MEQLPLIHRLPPISLLHLSLLPLVDFPEGHVLDPLDLLNAVVGHRAGKEVPDLLKLFRGRMQGDPLKAGVWHGRVVPMLRDALWALKIDAAKKCKERHSGSLFLDLSGSLGDASTSQDHPP